MEENSSEMHFFELALVWLSLFNQLSIIWAVNVDKTGPQEEAVHGKAWNGYCSKSSNINPGDLDI